MEDYCIHNFWGDVPACLDNSPSELKLYLSINILCFDKPEFYQDANIIAKALVMAIERGKNNNMHANATAIWCATIARNPDTGKPRKVNVAFISNLVLTQFWFMIISRTIQNMAVAWLTQTISATHCAILWLIMQLVSLLLWKSR